MKQHRRGWFWPATALLAVLGIGFGLGRGGGQEVRPTPTPVVLQQVRDLGELHLVQHQYQTVFEMESHKDAPDWTQEVPVLNRLASSIAEGATKNVALVTVTGTVEAGIDLSQAEISQRGNSITVVIPAAKIYPANVDAVLHSQKRGVTWDDRNLALKARREGANRFEKSSREAGILEDARKRAVDQVTRLFDAAGVDSVNVEFKGEKITS
ncbi:hypothetical protein C0431_06775 [bacterium]|nr:hypothetical protein [bacterium]